MKKQAVPAAGGRTGGMGGRKEKPQEISCGTGLPEKLVREMHV